MRGEKIPTTKHTYLVHEVNSQSFMHHAQNSQGECQCTLGIYRRVFLYTEHPNSSAVWNVINLKKKKLHHLDICAHH